VLVSLSVDFPVGFFDFFALASFFFFPLSLSLGGGGGGGGGVWVARGRWWWERKEIFCCQLLLRPFWPMAMQMPQLQPEEAKIFLLLLLLLSSSFFFFLPLLLLDTSLLRLLLLLLLLLQPPFNQSSICIVFFSLHRFYFDLFRPLDVFIYKCECLPPVFSFPGIYFLHFFISLFDIADFENDHYWLR